ncbi:hypothetical protein ACFTQ7_21555 [Lysinibacillus sp. NPDC056959]|uniref:hypothetical protein n=1 Tax=Lysinibacillus sp. NPDC056959 TaxID=3345981 RepID=UPI00362A17A8
MATINGSITVFATLLQFLVLIVVVAYVSLSLKKCPAKYQVIGIMDTGVGLFLLLTNASIDALIVSSKVLLWGVEVGLMSSFLGVST